jgi:hypothetical protein
MAATLIAVAVIASRIMNLEKDRSRLKATRRAMKDATFKQDSLTSKLLNFVLHCHAILFP